MTDRMLSEQPTECVGMRNAWPANGVIPISWSLIMARNCVGGRWMDGLMITVSSSISSTPVRTAVQNSATVAAG